MNDSTETVGDNNRGAGAGDADRATILRILLAAGLLTTAWLGVNVAWSLSDDTPTFVSAQLMRVAPLWLWLAGTIGILATATAASWGRRHAEQWLGLLLMLYLVGGLVVEFAVPVLAPAGGVPMESAADSISFLCQRSFLLLPALAMMGGTWLVGRSASLHCLALGDWSASVGLTRGIDVTWRSLFVAWLVGFALPVFLLMQATVEFAPLSHEGFLALLIPLVGMSLLNGFVEELLFRGLLMPPIVACSGRTTGLWLQALFFGLHHWGASHAAIENLPAAVVVSLVAVVWGKSVLDTRGLGWAVVTHATVDFALFSSHFVSTT